MRATTLQCFEVVGGIECVRQSPSEPVLRRVYGRLKYEDSGLEGVDGVRVWFGAVQSLNPSWRLAPGGGGEVARVPGLLLGCGRCLY